MVMSSDTLIQPGAGTRCVQLCQIMWKYSLKFSLRSLFRFVVRGLSAKLIYYPDLQGHEWSRAALEAYVARRCRRVGLPPPRDAGSPIYLTGDQGLMTKN